MAERFLYPTGCDLNANFDVQPDFFGGAKVTCRINIKSPASIARVREWSRNGHAVYPLFGHEADETVYGYSEAGLDAFLRDHGRFIAALTNRNEWDVEPNIERTLAENAWAHRVCKAAGIPFAISSTLVQDWHGGITGLGGPGQWPGLANLYRPGEVDGELVDLHLYSYGNGGNLGRMLAQYRMMGYREPTIIGEFGTAIGDEIPVREMFDAVLDPAHGVGAAVLFCLQDFDDPDKRFGLLRTDGSRKDAFDAFVQVARERQDQKYILPGGVIVPPPDLQFKYAFAEYAATHPEVGTPDEEMWYTPHRDDGGKTFDQVITYTSTGKMEFDSRTNKVRFFPAAS